MSVLVGTETYGRVKAVSGTAIVTAFAGFYSLPIYPIQSYYYSEAVEPNPFRAPPAVSRSADRLALACVDRASVAIAYMRGVCGMFVVVGFLAVVPLLSELMGERLDEMAVIMTRVLYTCFVVGVVGGSLTYAMPTVSGRERNIRRYCGELLGVTVDPARLSSAGVDVIQRELAELENWDVSSAAADQAIRQIRRIILELVHVRLQIAQGYKRSEREAKTDKLLVSLDRLTMSER